jgi:hypothetical protein
MEAVWFSKTSVSYQTMHYPDLKGNTLENKTAETIEDGSM